MRQALELIVEQIINGENEDVNPLEDHPDLGMSIGSGWRDDTFINKVMNHSQQMQRGYPELYATIPLSFPEDLREIAKFSTGIRTSIYEHVGDLAHRAGSSHAEAMISKVKNYILRYNDPSNLKEMLKTQGENNCAFLIAMKEKKRTGVYDFNKARMSKEYFNESPKIEEYNKLLDTTYAAIYSRLQSFTPLQAAGRNAAIAFGMERYALFYRLGEKIDEFFKFAKEMRIEHNDLYKLGFNVKGVNNLSRTDNKLKDQWETNLRVIEYQLKNQNDHIGTYVQGQLQSQIPPNILAEPLRLLDELMESLQNSQTN
jgi:hypothetical protein